MKKILVSDKLVDYGSQKQGNVFLLYILTKSCQSKQGRSRSNFDHEIFSMIILSLLLIQEGQLSVSGERMCTSTG